jgi:RNA polymerase sigma-70 factor, ECF subfamily
MNGEEQEDTELMMAVRLGDERAFAALAHLYRARLRGFYLSLGEEADSAEDLAQEALLRLWVARERYEPSGRFSAYLFQIARNCWLNTQRSRKRHPAEPAGDASAEPRISPAWPWNPVFNAYRMREVRRAIASLPKHQREVFVLCHLQGFTNAEAAEMLGVPVGTVKSRMSAAVRRLRDALEHWREPE